MIAANMHSKIWLLILSSIAAAYFHINYTNLVLDQKNNLYT